MLQNSILIQTNLKPNLNFFFFNNAQKIIKYTYKDIVKLNEKPIIRLVIFLWGEKS